MLESILPVITPKNISMWTCFSVEKSSDAEILQYHDSQNCASKKTAHHTAHSTAASTVLILTRLLPEPFLLPKVLGAGCMSFDVHRHSFLMQPRKFHPCNQHFWKVVDYAAWFPRKGRADLSAEFFLP